MIQFDPTINLGTIITFIGFVIGGLSFAYAIREQVKVLSADMVDVKEDLKKLSEVAVSLAVQDEQFKSVNRRLDVLERRP